MRDFCWIDWPKLVALKKKLGRLHCYVGGGCITLHVHRTDEYLSASDRCHWCQCRAWSKREYGNDRHMLEHDLHIVLV